MDELLWGVPLKEVALQRAFKKWAGFKPVLIVLPFHFRMFGNKPKVKTVFTRFEFGVWPAS